MSALRIREVQNVVMAIVVAKKKKTAWNEPILLALISQCFLASEISSDFTT